MEKVSKLEEKAGQYAHDIDQETKSSLHPKTASFWGYLAGYKECEKEHNFIPVDEQEPPNDIDLLVKSPSGILHLCHWRPSYKIFTCQEKRESSSGWEWKIP